MKKKFVIALISLLALVGFKQQPRAKMRNYKSLLHFIQCTILLKTL